MSSQAKQDLRYRHFANKVFVEDMPASHAYAEVFKTDKDSPSTMASASRLLRHDKVQQYQQGLSQQYLQDAAWAYQRQKTLAEKPSTPASVRNSIYESIQNKAGLGQTIKTEIQDKSKYPEFNVSREELQEWIDQIKV